MKSDPFESKTISSLFLSETGSDVENQYYLSNIKQLMTNPMCTILPELTKYYLHSNVFEPS